MNNKGFMMAEVIVVAAIILAALTGFYALYTSAISTYNTTLNYYDVPTLYALAAYKNSEDYDPESGNEGCKDNGKSFCFLLKGDRAEKVYSLELVRRTSKDDPGIYGKFTDISVTLREYLNYLAGQFKENTDILVMERCSLDDDGNYTLNCKYAYLEVGA